jgi:orotidine-5'-phosphate decarboxylase
MDAERTIGVMDDAAAGRLIVALDVEDYKTAARLVRRLSPHVAWFKVGSVLFTREGPGVCRLIKESNARLFLDLKFHDIPNTVYGAVRSAIGLGADMATVHVAGGEAMLRAAVRARDEADRSGVILLGVTVLTHFSLDEFQALLASQRSTEETVLAFAALAARTGLDGVVSSARELSLIRSRMGPELKVVTPGIRLAAEAAGDDQVRVVEPRDAVRGGADYIVVGRPITAASDPLQACQRILDNMRE